MKKNIQRVLFYGGQALVGAALSVGLMAGVLHFGNAGAKSAAAPSADQILRQMEDGAAASSIDRLIESREESRFVEEENSRILAEAAEGFNEAGWHSSAEKDVGNGDKSVWSKFRDYALLGDSRAVGFSFYSFLESRRVLAESGASIISIPSHYEELRSLSPSYVIFCFGLNDSGSRRWMDGESYAAEFMEYIEEIRSFLPDAKFIISSVLPTTDASMERNPAWKRIELYNASLKVECPKHNVVFVNNDGIAAQYIDTLWEPDGVHLSPAFYPYWANNIYSGMLQARAAAAGIGDTDTTETETETETTAQPAEDDAAYYDDDDEYYDGYDDYGDGYDED